MKMMEIGTSGIRSSRIGLGMLPIGGESVWGESDDIQSLKVIRHCREAGITLFDTAPAYGFGRSDRLLAQAMKGCRDQYILATKCGLVWDTGGRDILYSRDGHKVYRDLSYDGLMREIHESLKRLETDFIDLMLVHWPASERFPVPVSETMKALNQLKEEGLLRAIGACNLTLKQLKEYMSFGRLDLVQNRFSMLDRKAFHELQPYCMKHQISFQAYSPFERGILAGADDGRLEVRPGDARWGIRWYHKEERAAVLELLKKWQPLREKYGCTQAGLTVAWTLAQGENVSLDVGSRRTSSMDANVAGACITLEPEDLERMNRELEELLACFPG